MDSSDPTQHPTVLPDDAPILAAMFDEAREARRMGDVSMSWLLWEQACHARDQAAERYKRMAEAADRWRRFLRSMARTAPWN